MANDNQLTSRDLPWWGYLPVYLAPFLLFLPALIPGKALFWGITSLQFIPWHWEALRSLQAGEWPLWNIWNGMGAPLAANYQSALFYPPTWLTLLAGWAGGIQWMAWSHGLLIVLHLVWAGVGMKKLIEFLGLSPIPQIICGISYSLCGYLVARGSFLTMIQAATWIPWIILAASQFATPIKMNTPAKINAKSIMWFALAFSGQWLAGHAQLAWYTLLFSLTWIAVGVLVNGGWRRLIRIIPPVALTGLIAFLLCSIQLLPTIEYFTQSQRSGAIDYQTALSYSFWPWRILTLIFPDIFGNPGAGDFWGYANYWEDAIYFGLLPLFFSIYFLFSWKQRKTSGNQGDVKSFTWFCAVSICVIFMMALGWNTPVFPWLFKNVATFGSFNGPTRWMILAVFCLILLAGFGAEEWIRHPLSKRNYIYMSLVGVMAMVIAGIAAIFTMPAVKESFKSALIATGVLLIGYLIIALIKPSPEKIGSTRNWRFLFIIWLMIDLFWAGWRLNPAADSSLYTTAQNEYSQGRVYFSQTSERDLRFKRFFEFEDIRESAVWKSLIPSYLPNSNILSSMRSFNNFDPMLPDRFVGYTVELESATPAARQRLLALANVGQEGIVGSQSPFSISWDPIEANPEVWMAGCAEIVKDEKDALDWIRTAVDEDALRDTIVIESQDTNQQVCAPGKKSKAEVSIIARRSIHQEYRISGNEIEGYLFLADTWYPGWVASVDGKETPLYRADYVFMAVKVPAGEHDVILEYKPASFIFGALLTLAGIIFCVILGVWRKTSSGG